MPTYLLSIVIVQYLIFDLSNLPASAFAEIAGDGGDADFGDDEDGREAAAEIDAETHATVSVNFFGHIESLSSIFNKLSKYDF